MIHHQSQRGVILIGLMLVLVIAASLVFLQRANGLPLAREREAKTIAALTAARDALLARAALDDNRPGSLPCPDLLTNIPGNNIPGDGKADLLAGDKCPAYAGWLPWRTLDMDDPRDASGTSLWYVLSPNFRDSDAVAVNSESAAELTLDGQGDIVALIIAPGGAVNGQKRPSNDIADYLDDLNPTASNRDGDRHFFSGPASASFNDVTIPLTKTAWLAAVSMRVLGEIRHAVPANTALPEADKNGDGYPDEGAESGYFPYLALDAIESPSWEGHLWYESLNNNGWFALVAYDRSQRSISLNGHTVLLP
ncbi:MAG: hypothetical protein FWF20_04275 [Betaproteobacteria bacterium]|nr:hypothetical protein [Betaproteobacteria bacterium]MCL2885995.1 hypothetical protein [Betaproteobacteria bacterium]